MYIKEVADIAKKFPYSYKVVEKMWSMGLTEKEMSLVASTIGNEVIVSADGSWEEGWHHMARNMAWSKHEINKMQIEILSKQISVDSENQKNRQKRFRDFPCWSQHRYHLST